MAVSCESLIESLPIGAGELEIRVMRREDLDERAKWPLYPWPYESFNGTYTQKDRQDLDVLFAARTADVTRMMLVADHPSESVVAYFSLNQVDWDAGEVGNVGFRVKPTWCDRGIGTLMMRAVVAWLFDQGFRVVRFDVSAANLRAIRCYEKCGFRQMGEFWRDDESLSCIDLDGPQYDYLRPHVRFDGGIPQVRFYWMQLAKGSGDPQSS